MKQYIKHIISNFFKEKKVNNDFNKSLSEKERSQIKVVHKAFNEVDKNRLTSELINSDLSKMWRKLGEQKRTNSLYTTILRYVAVVVFSIGISYLSFNYLSSEQVELSNYSKYITGDGETSTIELSDGTKIFLKPNSELKVPSGFSANNRSLEFKGQAFFEVFKNSNSIFKIGSGDYKVEVLGTQFNLRAYDDEDFISTNLVEGKVRIDLTSFGIDSDIILNPNENIIYNKNTNKYKKQKFSKSYKVDWKSNELIFHNENFAKIIKNLELTFNKRIIVENEALLKESFSGKFNSDSLFVVLSILQSLKDFEIENNKDTIIIR